MRHGTRVGRPGHGRWRADERAGPANVNPVAAPARMAVAAPRRRARAAGPAGTWAWFAALLSLLLAGNLVTCRYLFWDAFYDLYAERYILQHGIPHQNLITVASHGAAWEDQQWLAQVLTYATWALGGYRLLAAASAVVCTPYGAGVIQDYARFIGNPALTHTIVEWARPSPLDPYSWAFFALIPAVAIAVAFGWRRGARPDPLLCGLALVLLAVAFTAVRNQQWFAFGGSLLAADTLARGNAGRAPELRQGFRRVMAGVLATLAVASAGLLALTSSQQFQSKIPGRAIDVAAVLAARNPAGRILGDPWSGTAMLWLHPATIGRVGFDARMELYSASQLSAYFDFVFVRGHRWQRVTHGYGIIVASRAQDPGLAATLGRLPGWRVVYRASTGLVLQRQAGA